MLEHLEVIKKVAKSLVRRNIEEDYRDLVQDTIIKLLKSAPKAQISPKYVGMVCKSVWLDSRKAKSVRDRNTGDFIYLYDEHFYPDIEEQIECKQLNIDYYNWPKNYSSKRKGIYIFDSPRENPYILRRT